MQNKISRKNQADKNAQFDRVRKKAIKVIIKDKYRFLNIIVEKTDTIL